MLDDLLEKVSLPFEGGLRDYQIEDVKKACVFDRYGFYHEMGLGKSVMAALVGGHKLLRNWCSTVFVLCPAAICHEWLAMLNKMGFKSIHYRGNPRERENIKLDHDFVVMSYEIFRQDYSKLSEVKDVFFIVDEATILCNYKNILWRMLNGGQVTKNKKKFMYPKLAEKILLLTGTPTNNPTDAYGLIKTVSPDVYKNYSQFFRIHVAEVDFFGNPKEYRDLEYLGDSLRMSASIRSTADHIQLPDLIVNIKEYDLEPEHQRVYDELVETRLAAIGNDVVIDATTASSLYNWAQRVILRPDKAGYTGSVKGIDIMDVVVNGVNQIILMNKYVDTNSMFVDRYGFGGVYGEISRADQDKNISDFKEGKLRGLVCNVKSAGYGLNLQNCHQMAFGELPVTPRDFFQAVARIRRQGQTNVCIITLLVANKTIQKRLLRKLIDKDDLSQAVLRTPLSLRKALTGTDICDNKSLIGSAIADAIRAFKL